MKGKSKIERFDQAACRTVADAFHKLMEDFAKQYGLVAKRGGGKFDSKSFTPKVTFCIPAEDGHGNVVNKKELDDYKFWAPFNGIDPDSCGKTVILKGKLFTIAGWNSKARTAPIILKDAQGNGYKCKTDAIRAQHPKKEVEPVKEPKSKQKVAKSEKKSKQPAAPEKDSRHTDTDRCCYCGKPATPYVLGMNAGACNKPRCVLLAMREEPIKYQNVITKAREERLKKLRSKRGK